MTASTHMLPLIKHPKYLVMVLAKAPVVGHVKTRLGADVGAFAACQVYRSLAEEAWANLLKARASLGFEVWLAYDLPESKAQMQAWLSGAEAYLPQATGNLGDRICDCFQAGFDAGFHAVLITGTDAPDVTSKHYEGAFAKVAPMQAVVGPSEDGGFYLLTLPRTDLDLHVLFDNISWSTESTRETLHNNALRLGLGWTELEPLLDVDTLQDLHRVRPGLLAP